MGNRELSRLSQTTIGPNRWIRKTLCNRLIKKIEAETVYILNKASGINLHMVVESEVL